MQFKHPEILYFLFALLIPVFIHLFQLQRFTKEPFTNVAFLKTLEIQSRRSSRIKKWLTLLMRLLALAALIIAFAQPYIATTDTAKPWETIVILDNSISMQAENEQGELLKSSVRDLLENMPEKGSFSLFTQDETFENLDRETFREIIKKIDYIGYDIPVFQLMLRVQNYVETDPSKQYSILWLTDLQKTQEQKMIELPDDLELTLIPLKAKISDNYSIESVKVVNQNKRSLELLIKIKNSGVNSENYSVSAYHDDILLGKTLVESSENLTTEVLLKLSENYKKITLQLDKIDRYDFDNLYYMSFQNNDKIKVLEVSDTPTFFSRIMDDEEIEYSRVSSYQFPYDRINDYAFIVLNEIQDLPASLVQSVLTYIEDGGSLTFIPSENNTIEQVNYLFKSMNLGSINALKKDSLLVTKIHYNHALFNSVFEHKVENFQYPIVRSYFDISSINASPVLSFQDDRPFLVEKSIGKGHFYSFVSALNAENSNFTNAPLVVPVFYKMAINADISSNLSVYLGETQTVTIKHSIDQEKILRLVKNDFSVIPLQTVKPDEITLVLDETIKNSGFYQVNYDGQTLENIAFNTKKTESNMSFWSIDDMQQKYPNLKVEQHIKKATNDWSKDRTVHEYFKILLLLALVFFTLEMLILKYL